VLGNCVELGFRCNVTEIHALLGSGVG